METETESKINPMSQCACCKAKKHCAAWDGLCFSCWCEFYNWCHEFKKAIFDFEPMPSAWGVVVKASLDEFLSSRPVAS